MNGLKRLRGVHRKGNQDEVKIQPGALGVDTGACEDRGGCDARDQRDIRALPVLYR
jgi:hypothetical protein